MKYIKLLNHLVKISLAYITLFIFSDSNAQKPSFCVSGNYRFSNEVFTTNQVDSVIGIYYKTAKDYLGNDVSLYYDIKYPNKAADNLSKRPLIVLVHGGVFYEGQRRSDEINHVGFNMVKRGFVVATIDYRLGWPHGDIFQCTGDADGLNKAIYRAVQDLKSALHHIVDRALTYEIDTDNIFIGGFSAGAITALHTAFAQQNEFDPNGTLTNSLGPLDPNPNPVKIKGVMSMWGALTNQTWITGADVVPVIMFHDAYDGFVPYGAARPFNGCSNFPIYYGSGPIYNQIINAGACFELNLSNSATHGFTNYYEPMYVGTSNRNNIYGVISNRLGIFARYVMCNDCRLRVINYYDYNGNPSGAPVIQPFKLDVNFTFDSFAQEGNLTVNDSEQGKVTIVDFYGRVYLDKEVTKNEISLRLSNLPEGVFIVIYSSGNGSAKFLFSK